MVKNKTVVVGLDGAHFEILEPWLESGDLPNIKRCMEEGVYADLEVCLPPVTSPNWKCYSTGLNPGKLGIFWWENIDKEEKKVYYPSGRKNNEKEIWDCLGENGYKVGVIGTPLTYPPKQVNGVMISGGLDAEENNFTYPNNLEENLQEKYDYKVHPEHSIQLDKEGAIEEIHNLIRLRFQVGKDLIKENDLDFLQITTFYLNVLQHFLWDANQTKEAWKIIDKELQDFIENDNINLILMSDHGSNEIERSFNINTWLYENDYIEYNWKFKISKFFSKIGFSRANLAKLTNFIGIKNALKKILPKGFLMKIPKKGSTLEKGGKMSVVDWESSDAVASGQGPIYILNKDKKEEIAEKLKGIKTENGKNIINEIFEKEDIYQGQYLEEAPDLILDQAPNIHIKGSVGADEIFETDYKWRAENKKYGLFIGRGPDIKQTTNPDKVSILDLAPTLLNLYGINPPKKMDGKKLDIIKRE